MQAFIQGRGYYIQSAYAAFVIFINIFIFSRSLTIIVKVCAALILLKVIPLIINLHVSSHSYTALRGHIEGLCLKSIDTFNSLLIEKQPGQDKSL